MINRNRVRYSKLALGLAIALAAAPAFAQSTSSALGGRISDAGGQPVAGADVSIVHIESGTVTHALTDGEGRYIARGLRVGGPYTITITKDGKTETREGVYLKLAETASLDASLGATATQIGAVNVVASSDVSVFSPSAMGASTSISGKTLNTFASIKRDLQDYARLDPRLSQTDKVRGEISAAGQNVRYNTVTIDGVNTSDTFGLESNNLPTERQPISIDAIDSVQVNVSNYDVTQGRYTGANINAVTKSGTNAFHGSLTYLFRNAGMVGDLNGAKYQGFDDERTYGFTLGGPIVKDRLFFFANYEKSERTQPGSPYGPAGSGAAIEARNISQSEIDQIIQIAHDKWGIDAGTLNPPSSNSTTTENKLIKLDWNITDSQRFSFRANEVEQSVGIFPDNSTSKLSLSTHWYDQVKTFKTYVAQLYSDWSDNFSTELKVSYRDYNSQPINRAEGLPQVIVDVGGASVYFGTEEFRHLNVLQTKTRNFYGAGNWFLGDHEVKFGVDYESNDVYNLFVSGAYGVFAFPSIAAFQAGTYAPNPFGGSTAAANGFTLRAPAAGANPAAEYTLDNIALFAQDTWSVNNNLTLTYGVRLDTPKINDRPLANACVALPPGATSDPTCPNGGFGRDNTITIDGNKLLQPRFGFNYTFDSERQTQLRGGVGLFQGTAANVWLANPFTNNGRTIAVFAASTGTIDSLTNPTPPAATTPKQDIDMIADGVKQPSVWKENLAFDHELPFWGLVGTAELILTQTQDGFAYYNLNLGAPTGTAPDGRQIYWANPATGGGSAKAGANPTFNSVFLTKRSGGGGGTNLTFSLSKPQRDSHWFWQVAYSYTNATETNPLTSSRASSNWNNTAGYNTNVGEVGRSAYAIKDRITAAVSYERAFFGDYKTTIAAFYEGRTGRPYSFTYANDANGDGISGNDLMYIPLNPDDVIFTGANAVADEKAFWDYVAANPELSNHRGQVVPRNGSNAPWTNSIDLRLSQELPGFFKNDRAELWVDVQNIGNLFNNSWGRVDEFAFDDGRGGYVRNFVNYAGIDPVTHKYIYRSATQEGFNPKDLPSRWSLQLGFTYRF